MIQQHHEVKGKLYRHVDMNTKDNSNIAQGTRYKTSNMGRGGMLTFAGTGIVKLVLRGGMGWGGMVC